MEWKVAPTYQSWQIDKIDEEAHKAHVFTKCWKCGGTGQYAWFGTCFSCEGSGYHSKWVKMYSPAEYDKYVAAQEKAKERKAEKENARIQSLKNNSEQNKKDLLNKFGYDADNPKVYIVTGDNTYNIKEELKKRGGRFNPDFGWYFTKETEVPEGYSLIAVDFDDVYEWFPIVKRIEIKDSAKEVINQAKIAAAPPSASEFVGEIKQRIRGLKVVLTGARTIEGYYGTSVLFTFKAEENILIWFTSSPPDSDKAIVGHEYLLTATIKEHELYNGVKQTKVNRCILKEVC